MKSNLSHFAIKKSKFYIKDLKTGFGKLQKKSLIPKPDMSVYCIPSCIVNKNITAILILDFGQKNLSFFYCTEYTDHPVDKKNDLQNRFATDFKIIYRLCPGMSQLLHKIRLNHKTGFFATGYFT